MKFSSIIPNYKIIKLDLVLLYFGAGLVFFSLSGNRFVFEGISLLICMCLLGLGLTWIVFFVALLQALFLDLLNLGACLSLAYYLLFLKLLYKPTYIELEKQWLCIVILFCAALTIVLDFSISNLRPSGAFNSPLSASYFFGSLCAYFVFQNKYFLSLVAAVATLLTGSRSGFLIALSPFLSGKRLKYSLILLIPPIAILSALNVSRSLSFHGVSDTKRFAGYAKFLNYDWDPITFFIGQGRVKFGSLGHSLGGDGVTTIESSYLQLIAAYGFVGVIIFVAILYGLLIRRNMVLNLFVLIGCVSIIMDGLGVLLIVFLLLFSIVYRKHAVYRSVS